MPTKITTSIIILLFLGGFTKFRPVDIPDKQTAWWGLNGHRIVAQIAENHLTPAAKQEVKKLLGDIPLARVAVWADKARGMAKWSHTRTWHYTTIPDGKTYKTAERQPEGDVITALRKYEKVLRDENADKNDKAIALKFFIHFVGDIHQPLHVGNGLDRGGNDVDVRWYGERTNLHTVWDSKIIDHTQLSFTEFVLFIDHASDQEIKKWQNTTYVDWATESFALRKKVYRFTNSGSSSDLPYLSWGYRNMAVPVVEDRLLKAGIRLAGILNDIFGS